MIAYRTFADCPEQDRPSGVLLSFPWVQLECTEEETAALEEQGYTVVTQEVYDALVSSLTDTNQASMMVASIKSSILTPAITFGNELIIDFAAENIGMGITQSEMTPAVRLATKDVVAALSTGSLYDAITAARAIPAEQKDAVFVTDVRLLVFINKIESYLGIPLSTEL
jgi:hypothetical protein